MVNSPTRFRDCDSHIPAILDLFPASGTSIFFTMAFPPLENSSHVVSQLPLTFLQIHNGMPRFIAWLMTILVLIGMVFVII